jgi:hypothetical protein
VVVAAEPEIAPESLFISQGARTHKGDIDRGKVGEGLGEAYTHWHACREAYTP